MKEIDLRSATSTVANAIPQGTLPVPLLFILSINNMFDGQKHSNIQLYADDSKLYRDATSIEQCQALERDILTINDWLQSWQLKINLEKCEVPNLTHRSL